LLLLAAACVSSPARAKPPPGKTLDVPFDAVRVTQRPDEAHVARLYLAPEVLAASATGANGSRKPLPLVVFLHGVNGGHQPFRFAGHGGEPDIRDIAARLMREGGTSPFVLGAPSTVVSSDFPLSLWPSFDLDRFVEEAATRLRDQVTIDLSRVVVVGHSGAGCNPRGGVFSAARQTTLPLRAVLLVDTCLDLANAPLLVELPPSVDVIVSFQTRSWPRPFDEFTRAFVEPRRRKTSLLGAARAPLVVSEERVPTGAHVHNAMVEDALRAYLPNILARELSPKNGPRRRFPHLFI
jgi:hypothetical protein